MPTPPIGDPDAPAGRTPEDLLANHPLARAVFERVADEMDRLGGVETRTTKSQIAFRRARGFAFLWLPGRYLFKPGAEVVLSISLPRPDASSRWKEVAHPAPRHWMHHLEINDPDEIDAEVTAWLSEAANDAG